MLRGDAGVLGGPVRGRVQLGDVAEGVGPLHGVRRHPAAHLRLRPAAVGLRLPPERARGRIRASDEPATPSPPLPLAAVFVAEEAYGRNQEQQQGRNGPVEDVGDVRERFRDRYCNDRKNTAILTGQKLTTLSQLNLPSLSKEQRRPCCVTVPVSVSPILIFSLVSVVAKDTAGLRDGTAENQNTKQVQVIYNPHGIRSTGAWSCYFTCIGSPARLLSEHRYLYWGGQDGGKVNDEAEDTQGRQNAAAEPRAR